MSNSKEVQKWFETYLFTKYDHTRLTAEQWDEIYENGGYGGQGSGAGSLLEHNEELIKIFDDFVIKNEIKSLIDIGCGAMQWLPFSNTFSELDYTGIDGSQIVIESNIEKLSSPTKKFICSDLFKFESDDEFDLLLCKDVYQHNQSDELKQGLTQKIKSIKSKHKMVIVPQDLDAGEYPLTLNYMSDEMKTIMFY